jgi:hypothetical protein
LAQNLPSFYVEQKAGPGNQEESGVDEYKLYCQLCHIGFLKESSYRSVYNVPAHAQFFTPIQGILCSQLYSHLALLLLKIWSSKE